MKKVGILTINDNNNYGNRLQNYAVQKILNHKKINAITLKNQVDCNFKCKNLKLYSLKVIKSILIDLKIEQGRIRRNILGKNPMQGRQNAFRNFNKYIKFSKRRLLISHKKKINKKYDYFIVGSDQVWNPNFNRLSYVDLLEFANPNKRISFSASFGISQLPEKYKEETKEELKKFKMISVREDAGKKIVEELTGRKDIEVLVDPTMLLTADEWDEVSKKPKQLHTDRYILNYFLGELSEERKKQINKIAKDNNCEVINILDKNSPFYQTGPSEFLYLEKNAFLICTDSFHSSVFSIIYNRPFIVFDREDSNENMNSRIDTLLKKFNLEYRKYTGKITDKYLKCDYSEAHEIIKKERGKAIAFLNKALDIK